MKKLILILMAVIIFSVFNYSIYKNEKIKKSEDIVYLEIAPKDPRSLMQGDYMEFRYTTMAGVTCDGVQNSGYVVIEKDSNGMGKFKRCYDGEDLQPQEKLFHYNKQYMSIQIVPDSFLFQEGLAPSFQKAKYAMFKFSGNKKYLLVGLADPDMKMIQSHQ